MDAGSWAIIRRMKRTLAVLSACVHMFAAPVW